MFCRFPAQSERGLNPCGSLLVRRLAHPHLRAGHDGRDGVLVDELGLAVSPEQTGETVHLEDLVLRDAAMDVRIAVDGTNRAMSVLRARRLVARRGGAWALSAGGLDTVRGGRTGSGNSVPAARERSELVYDRNWDEEERLAEWRDVVKATDKLPALVAAAIAFDAWCRIAPLQHAGWIGSLLVSALLQKRGKSRHHLAALNVGMRAAPYRRAQFQDLGTRIVSRLRRTAGTRTGTGSRWRGRSWACS